MADAGPGPRTPFEARFRALGSPCSIHLCGPRERLEGAAAAAIAEVRRIERKYSRYRAQSVLSRINASAGDPQGVLVDDETAALLDYADTLHRESDGLFDVTSGVLRRVWDFRSGRVPDADEVATARRRIGWERVRWERPRVALEAGMELDFGGFGKEWASDRAAETCRAHGVRSGMIDLGGDLAAIGPRPGGEPWRVGIRHPRTPRTAIATVPLARGGVATSGDYERFMVVGGRRYGHVLSPRTGYPVEGLVSVSVLATHCLVAGSASTIATLKGEDEGARWLDQLGLPNLRVTQDGRISGTLARAA